MMQSLRFVFLLLLGLLLAVPSTSQVAPFAPATSTPPPFLGRKNFPATVFYGRTYFVGGGTNSGVLNDIWNSDDDGVSWQEITPNVTIPAAFNTALVTIQTTVDNAQLLLFIVGNTTYFSVDGVNFTVGSANYSARDGVATAIALPVRDQSGVPLLNGLPALFVLGGRGVTLMNDVYYTSGSRTVQLRAGDRCSAVASSISSPSGGGGGRHSHRGHWWAGV